MSIAFGPEADEMDKVEKLEEKMHQVFTILMQLTEGEANDLVSNAGGQELEAWRKLARRWDLSTGGRARNLFRFILNPGKVPMNELAGSIER